MREKEFNIDDIELDDDVIETGQIEYTINRMIDAVDTTLNSERVLLLPKEESYNGETPTVWNLQAALVVKFGDILKRIKSLWCWWTDEQIMTIDEGLVRDLAIAWYYCIRVHLQESKEKHYRVKSVALDYWKEEDIVGLIHLALIELIIDENMFELMYLITDRIGISLASLYAMFGHFVFTEYATGDFYAQER